MSVTAIPIPIRYEPQSMRPIAPITIDADPASFSAGVAAGANMTDAEVLRYYNGIIATFIDPVLTLTMSPATARKRLGYAMDALAAQGKVASIGYDGSPIIRPLRPVQDDAS